MLLRVSNLQLFRIKQLTALLLLSHCLNSINAELNFGNESENNKNFDSVPTTVKTYENDTVLLPCYHNQPYHFVRWHRDDVRLVDSRHPEIKPPERIHLFENGSLLVSNVQTQDTGDYYCEIMSSSSHAVQIHAIEVQYAPTVVASPSGLVELPLGALFEMVCEAKGMPHPVITWRMKGETLEEFQTGNRQSHLFEIKTRSMSGPIECLATNGVGQPAVAGVYLNVLFTPEVTPVQPVAYTKIGQRVHLECLVTAAPAAKIHWFHHGLPVGTDHRVAYHDTELQSNRSLAQYFTETKSVLIIRKVTDSDFGKYECRAENKVGFKGVTIELTGRPTPCIFRSNPSLQSTTSHNLAWQTESLSPVVEFKLRFRQIPSANLTSENPLQKIQWNELTIPAEITGGPIYTSSYTLHGLQPASIYEVSALARNHFGWSDSSKIIRFATGGEVEIPNYSTESDLDYDQDTVTDFDNEIKEEPIVYVASMSGKPRENSGSAANSFLDCNLLSLWVFCGLLFFSIK